MHVPTVLSWWQSIGKLIFFERCRACGHNLQSDEIGMAAGLQAVCVSCWQLIEGRPPLFQWCKLDEGPCFPIASAAYYRAPLKKLIYRLKYDGDRLLVSDLSLLLKVAWIRLIPALQAAQPVHTSDPPIAQAPLITVPRDSMLVPIPLHPKRQRLRGFNHASLLAAQLGDSVDVRVEHRAMQRIKNTAPQHGLKRIERMRNLSGAFDCDRHIISGKTIILVDDIYTSGSTLAEAARTLISGGARSVAGLTVARAI